MIATSLLSALANGDVIVVAADTESVRALLTALAAKPEILMVEPPKRQEPDKIDMEIAYIPVPPPVNIPPPKKAGQSGAFYESLLRHKNKW